MTNSTFDCIICFQKVESKVKGYDYAYCVGNLIILFASLTNAIMLVMMLCWHIREAGLKKALKDTKTFIYVLLISVQTVVSIDYTFALNETVDDVTVIVTFNLITFSFLAVCYYFIEGASKLLDNSM